MGADNHTTVKPDKRPRDPQFDVDVDAILIAGPVASGKTTAMDVAYEIDGFYPYDMGDEAREIHADKFEGFRKSGQDEPPSVSKWAGKLKEDEGPAWLADRICDRYADWHNQYGGIPVISGVRSIEERERYAEAFGDVEVVWVWSTVWTRCRRALDRQDRKPYDSVEFFERDWREYQWGLDELTEDGEYDVWLPNEGVSQVQFRNMVQKVLIGVHRDEDDWQTDAPWHYGDR